MCGVGGDAHRWEEGLSKLERNEKKKCTRSLSAIWLWLNMWAGSEGHQGPLVWPGQSGGRGKLLQP